MVVQIRGLPIPGGAKKGIPIGPTKGPTTRPWPPIQGDGANDIIMYEEKTINVRGPAGDNCILRLEQWGYKRSRSP